MNSTPRFTETDSPLGSLLLVGDGERLHSLTPVDDPGGAAPTVGWVHDPDAFRHVTAQLDAYFSGRSTRFDVRLEPLGTPFQRQVWDAIADIGCGETVSYADLARRVGRPSAARAVGAAAGRNPLLVIVPCHRVVGRDGSLTGYRGGLERKRWLLAHEAALSARVRAS